MRSLLLVLLMSVTFASNSFAEADSSLDLKGPLAELVDAELNYDLGFLWLDQVAVATFTLQKSTRPGIYIGSLSAKTVGIAAPLTNHRKQAYISMMELLPDGSFRSLRHTSQKVTGGVVRAKVYQFDHENRQVHYQYFKDNKLIGERFIPVEDEVFPSDMITVYYNLVNGSYGPMEVGAHYEVPAFSRRGTGMISIDFLPSDKRPVKGFFPEDLLICKVFVDQDAFDTKDGTIYIGYDALRRAARGIVIDMIGLGDVRGVMKN